MSEERKPQVVVAGGGIAGLEALMALNHLAGDRVELTLIAPDPDFTYKPLIVEEPFSYRPAERRALEPIAAELGARFVKDAVTRFDPQAGELELGSGSRMAYDAAVVCVGAVPRPAYRRAATLLTAGEPLDIDAVLRDAAVEPGSRTIAFIVPPGATWPLPIYELALMTRRQLHERRMDDVECLVVTPESAPLVMFGPAPSDAVAALLRARGVAVRTGARVTEDEQGFTVVPGHERLAVAAAVALPALEGPAIPGLPADEHGFIPIDEHARVAGLDAVYAAGDGTTFPVKQGGLGTQQADAAAEHIAARFGADISPQPFHPVLRGQLLTGDESLSLRQDLTGGAGEGVVSDDYLWWPPHKVSGRYLAPWLAGEMPHADLEPPRHSIDVEVALPKEWHRDPMALDPYGPLGVD